MHRSLELTDRELLDLPFGNLGLAVPCDEFDDLLEGSTSRLLGHHASHPNEYISGARLKAASSGCMLCAPLAP